MNYYFLKRWTLLLGLSLALLGCKDFFSNSEADAINKNLDPMFENSHAIIATEFLNDTSVLDAGTRAIGVSVDSIVEPKVWVSEMNSGTMVIFRENQSIDFKNTQSPNFNVIGTWSYDQNLKEFTIKNTHKILFKEDTSGAWSGQLVLPDGELLSSSSMS